MFHFILKHKISNNWSLCFHDYSPCHWPHHLPECPLVTGLALGLSGGQGCQVGEHVLPELGGEAEVDIVVCPPQPGQHQHIVGGEVTHYVELGAKIITVLVY